MVSKGVGLLNPFVGTGSSRGAIVETLRSAEAEALSQLPHDDLYFVDSMAFSRAISAVDRERQVPAEILLKRYVASLELRTAQLERSRPGLNTIRSSQVTNPKPISEIALPNQPWPGIASMGAVPLTGSSPHLSQERTQLSERSTQ